MWYYRCKIRSIHGLSKGITHLRSVTTAKYKYTSKAYYSDHRCPKEKDISNLPLVKHISEYFIKSKHKVEESNQIHHLAPHDLAFLCFQYIHFGLMFTKPSHINNQEFLINSFLESLKKSLSLTLVHFYPLAGQLVTEVDEDKHESIVYVDCNKGPGARFIHAALDMTIYGILSPKDVPLVVKSFFDLNDETLNYDGHSKPLLSVQVTELLDGIFIACTVNHCLTDRTSYWHFYNVWSEIHRRNESHIVSKSNLPILTRWHPNGHALGSFPIPYTHPDEFVRRVKVEPPQISDRIFHFSSESIARLKAKANEEISYTKNISSFQSLLALIWRSTVRANRLPHNQITINNMAVNCRTRLNPPLPYNYFGNFFQILTTSTTTGELLENNLGWAATLLHQSVANFGDKNVRNYVNEWIRSPNIASCADVSNQNKTVGASNSPKFDLYGNEFGLGKPIAFRTGNGNKTNGLVCACPGSEGRQSVDLEICLSPDSMDALEMDHEFMAFVSDNELRSKNTE